VAFRRRFRETLATTGVPVIERYGPHETRLAVAVEACDALIAESKC